YTSKIERQHLYESIRSRNPACSPGKRRDLLQRCQNAIKCRVARLTPGNKIRALRKRLRWQSFLPKRLPSVWRYEGFSARFDSQLQCDSFRVHTEAASAHGCFVEHSAAGQRTELLSSVRLRIVRDHDSSAGLPICSQESFYPYRRGHVSRFIALPVRA